MGAFTVALRLVYGEFMMYFTDFATEQTANLSETYRNLCKGLKMTEQAKQILYSPVDLEDADFTIPRDPHEEYEDEEFEKFKSEMHDSQDDAKITVGKKLTDSRGRPMGKKTMECFECGIDDYTFSQLCTRIREDFGTGLYLLQGRDSKGKFKFKKVIGIQAPIDPDANKNDASPASLIASMSHAMAEQQDRFERLMLNAPTVQTDPIKQMTEMMTAMGGMMTALGLGSQNQQPAKTMLETLTELKLTKDIMGDLIGNAEGSGQVDNFWSAISETVKSFGGPLMQAVSLAQQQGKINPDGVIQPPALPSPESELKENPEFHSAKPVTESENMTLKEMREQLEFLLTQAKNKIEAAAVADFIIEQMPDEDAAYDSLEAFLQQDSCLDRCAMIVPEVNEYREWFINWRDAMLKKLAAMIESVEPDDLTTDTKKSDDAETPAKPEHSDAGDALPEPVDAAKSKVGDTVNSDGDTGGPGRDLRDS